MGMSMAMGKILTYKSKEDVIGLDTDVVYEDQKGKSARLDMKVFIEKCKKCKNNRILFDSLIRDIENNDLQLGFPVIIGMDAIATELGDTEALEIMRKVK
jgi:hypothetical protein